MFWILFRCERYCKIVKRYADTLSGINSECCWDTLSLCLKSNNQPTRAEGFVLFRNCQYELYDLTISLAYISPFSVCLFAILLEITLPLHTTEEKTMFNVFVIKSQIQQI